MDSVICIGHHTIQTNITYIDSAYAVFICAQRYTLFNTRMPKTPPTSSRKTAKAGRPTNLPTQSQR